MTIRTVTPEQIEELAFTSGQPIHLGKHEADITVDGVLYVARTDQP